LYSSLSILTLKIELNPNSGFTDAEGCFSISIRNKLKSKIGLRVEAIFSINLHKKDRAILELIKSYFFGVGNISPYRFARGNMVKIVYSIE
jgi:hypothetical protein